MTKKIFTVIVVTNRGATFHFKQRLLSIYLNGLQMVWMATRNSKTWSLLIQARTYNPEEGNSKSKLCRESRLFFLNHNFKLNLPSLQNTNIDLKLKIFLTYSILFLSFLIYIGPFLSVLTVQTKKILLNQKSASTLSSPCGQPHHCSESMFSPKKMRRLGKFKLEDFKLKWDYVTMII